MLYATSKARYHLETPTVSLNLKVQAVADENDEEHSKSRKAASFRQLIGAVVHDHWVELHTMYPKFFGWLRR